MAQVPTNMQNFNHTIWMGDLEEYMDETFVKRAFESMGEAVYTVKIIRNKHTGHPSGYCFVEFPDTESARNAMLKLNGKIIPGTSPTRRFKLNTASYGKEHLNVHEYSLFVGELTDDVDDLALFNCFKKYSSLRSAKVVLDNGESRGYGFVRFLDEADRKRALVEMQNYLHLGYRPIRVSLATPKRALGGNGSGMSPTYGDYGEDMSTTTPSIPDPLTAAVAAAVSGSSHAQAEYYHAAYAAYQNYYDTYYAGQQPSSHQQPPPAYFDPTQPPPAYDFSMQSHGDYGESHRDERRPQERKVVDEIVDPDGNRKTLEELNRIFIEETEEVFDALENSRWDAFDPSIPKLTDCPI